jgi:hypothetical protein
MRAADAAGEDSDGHPCELFFKRGHLRTADELSSLQRAPERCHKCIFEDAMWAAKSRNGTPDANHWPWAIRALHVQERDVGACCEESTRILT